MRALCLAYLFTLLTLALQTLGLSIAFGWQPTAIVSDSMAPSLATGDVLLLDRQVDAGDLEPGAIVTFDDPAVPGRTTTHRLEGQNADGTYRTRGDGNGRSDSTPVTREQILGVGRVVVPSLARPVAWLAEGQWLPLVVVTAATGVALWGAHPRGVDRRRLRVAPARRSPSPRRRLPLRRPVAVPRAAVVAGAVIAAAQLVPATVPATEAAFAGATYNEENEFLAAASFGGLGGGGSSATTYREVVMADAPVAYWRLGEAWTTVFQDDFESFAGWTDHSLGTVESSTEQAHGGTASGKKNLNNDPNGGWKSIGTTLDNQWSAEVWLYRPTVTSGGAVDRFGVENGSFNGYAFGVDHGTNSVYLDRRVSGNATRLATLAFDPPENAWYRAVLTRSGSDLSVALYQADGTLYVNMATVDGTYSTFDRVTVRGGYAYYLDDIVVSGLTRVAADEKLTHHGAYVGGDRQFGQPALITGDTDTAVRFDGVDDAVAVTDHVDINVAGAGYAARSVDLWFAADDATARQALWEEGGGTNGMVLYVEGGSLHARAWSETAGWSNVLMASTPVSASTRHHAAAVLDATGGALHLYLDGALVATATKPDTKVLSSHSDDGGIGGMFGNSEFPEGNTATGSAYFFRGVIDDVAIYNAVLSAARIEAHYRAGR